MPIATTLSLMLANQLGQFGAAGGELLVAADDVDQRVFQEGAEFVEGGKLAAVFEAGIDRQHAAAGERRLQQQIPQVVGKHFDRMRFGLFGEVAASLALQAGKHEARQSIASRSR